MPIRGFRSIGISESTYARFNEDYLKSRDDLAALGIRSLSGYMSYLLDSRIKEDQVLASHVPMIRKVSAEDGRVVILDNTIDRIAEVVPRDGKPYCLLCADNSCLHVGFAYALPELNAILASSDAESS